MKDKSPKKNNLYQATTNINHDLADKIIAASDSEYLKWCEQANIVPSHSRAKPAITPKAPLADNILASIDIAAILHELRNPLAAISAHVQVLEAKALSLDADLAKNFSHIHDGINHMSRLMEQFRHLSRLAPADLQRVNLPDIVEEILMLLQSIALIRNISLKTDICTEQAYCLLDESQIRRLITNLFINACDACAFREQPLIEISLKKVDQQAILAISDNGRGIDADNLKNIWQPFFTTKNSGTGLGLCACTDIANEHNGQLKLDNNPGFGCTFSLIIPLSHNTLEDLLDILME